MISNNKLFPRLACLIFLSLFWLGCVTPRAIPVKEYQARKDVSHTWVRSQDMIDEIARLSQISKNQVFTEEFEIP